MELKKSAATLDELVAQESEIKTSIRDLERQQKQIRITRKAFEKLTGGAAAPVKPHRRAKKSRRSKASRAVTAPASE